ncbi:DNAJC10 [Mytilus edulis]|uniref:DNAJC10 n=1 Tax=Mytilus edulis TaxID=6550 RepID=A0A8S3TCF6_MYTED|nr:DNAJC10 [Mytilus edulis]
MILNLKLSEGSCKRSDNITGAFVTMMEHRKRAPVHKISSLNAQEIAHQVLSWLPDVDNLDSKTLKKIINRLKTGQHHTWLIHFVEGDGSQDIEFRKLPAMLEGRATAHDVSAFAKDSMTTKLESLTLDDFQSQRVGPSSQSMWFIDFFAPGQITTDDLVKSDLCCVDDEGCTIIMLAARHNRIENLKELLDFSLKSVDAQYSNGLKKALDLCNSPALQRKLKQAHQRRQNGIVSPGLLEFTMEGNADKLYCLLEEGDVVDTKVNTN